MSIRCTNCGASVTDDSKFCKYCGTKLQEDQIQKIEVSGNIKKDISHRFSFNSEARIRKIEAQKELEEERLRQQTLQAEIQRQRAKEDHERNMKKLVAYTFVGIFVFLGFIILMSVAKYL